MTDTRRVTTCTINNRPFRLTEDGFQIADDGLQESGLIRCRGAMTLRGTHTPAPGSVVRFTMFDAETSGYVVPRRLRVLSSFADPRKRTTAVELGCLLTYRAGLKPPRNADGTFKNPTAKEEHGTIPCNVFELATIPISAEYVKNVILEALGISSSGPALTNVFSLDEYDLSGGYVEALGPLLVSEGLVGQMDAEDELRIVNLVTATDSGPVLRDPDLIEISPIGAGEVPAEAVTVNYNSKRLKSPQDLAEALGTEEGQDELARRNWELDVSDGGENFIKISFQDAEGVVQTAQQKQGEWTRTTTRYDAFDRVTRRESVSASGLWVANGSYVSEALAQGTKPGNLAANNTNITTYRYAITSGISVGGDTGPAANCAKNEAPDRRDELLEEETITRSPKAAIAGSVGFQSYVLDDGSLIDIFGGSVRTGRTVTTYDVNRAAGITRTRTEEYRPLIQTARGQQSLATQARLVTNNEQAQQLIARGSTIVLDKVTTRIVTQRDFGIERRPGQAQRNNAANDKPAIQDQKVEFLWVVGSPEARTTTEYTLPLAPDDKISWDAEDGYTSTPSDAPAKALAYGRIQNRIRLGNRQGMSIQAEPELLPPYAFDAFYVEIGGLVVQYRVNGRSWACDATDALGGCDGLLWGAVGAVEGYETAGSWVPLPRPTPPPEPEPGDPPAPDPPPPPPLPLLVPDDLPPVLAVRPIPPYRESVRLLSGVRAGIRSRRIPYSLQPVITPSAVGVRVGVTPRNRIGPGFVEFASVGARVGIKDTELPLATFVTGVAGANYSNGNRTVERDSGAGFGEPILTIVTGQTTGKYYLEVATTISSSSARFGFAESFTAPAGNAGTTGYGIAESANLEDNNDLSGGTTATGSGPIITPDPVLMLAIDYDAKKIWLGGNGTWVNSGDPAAGTGAARSGWSGTPALKPSIFIPSGTSSITIVPVPDYLPSGFTLFP